MKFIVTVEHQRSYDDPIAVHQGERVIVKQRDDEWPEFIWCINQNGQEGWIHENYLAINGNEGQVLADYSAIELTIMVGQRVTGHKEAGGWLWCSDQFGQSGWLPKKKLKESE